VLIHFSTDEVYGDIEHGAHTELDMLKPSNPYSASKAAADMLISAWARTYDINYVLLRPTNNYGVGQYVEKLIPKSIKYLNLGKKIDLHDRGEPRRTWLHADDTAQAVLAVIDSESTNEIFNISGNIELPNKEVIKKILSRIPGHGADQHWEDFITNSQRSGQDVRYSINDSKLKTLGWTAKANFDVELDRIVKYYTENFIW
jgi:dTDP-glucose 4,6-dehydratase